MFPPNLIPSGSFVGRVEPVFVLKAFVEGADGVLIAGATSGVCIQTGNIKTMRRFPLLRHCWRSSA